MSTATLARPDQYDAVLDRIQKIHEPYARHKHPLWRGLMDGKFERAQVAEFLRQASIIPLYNHLYHGPLYVICPDPEWRTMIAEVVYEEGTGRMHADGILHWKLWLRLGRAFGISDEDMWSVDLCPEALAWRTFFHEICSRNFLEGVSAHMLGAEAQVPGAAGSVAEGLQAKFKLSDADIAFYTVHDHADEEQPERPAAHGNEHDTLPRASGTRKYRQGPRRDCSTSFAPVPAVTCAAGAAAPPS